MPTSPSVTRREPGDRSARNTKWFVIGFAVVEALLLGWALLSGRIG